ncbi:hypothetical protein C6379_11740 [Pseudomonas syringae pv. actinidiae]|nr:hypothetical protein C6379_11740 [Pseudomonas syringae pv. actinidiae]
MPLSPVAQALPGPLLAQGPERLRCSGFRRILRRVEQKAVVTHQPAIGPEHLNQKLHIRDTHRLAGRNPQDASAVGVDHRGERQVVKQFLAGDTQLRKVGRGCKARHNLRCVEPLRIGQLDFRYQRLIQGRLDRQFPEPQRLRHTR